VRFPGGDPDSVAKSILAEKAFRGAPKTTDAAPQPALLEIVLKWIGEHVLKPLFGPLAHALAATPDVSSLLGVILIVAALGGLAFVIFRLALVFARPAPGARGSVQSRALGNQLPSNEWVRLARAAAARGDYAAAIGALFAAALSALDESSLVAFDPARTPGEYRRLVRRTRAAAAAPFDELAARFIRAAFAQDAPDERDFVAAERAFAALRPALAT